MSAIWDAAIRSLYTKGASVTAALAYMFASTNLAVEVAAPAFIFLGWEYAVALFVGAPMLVAEMAALVHLTLPGGLSRQALEHARNVEGHDMESSRGLPEGVVAKLQDETGWSRVGRSYVGEWRMVWKELLVGFTIAGAIAALVPV